MQAVAGELSGYAGKPPPLFELRRVRKAGKCRAIAKRRRIPLLFGEEANANTVAWRVCRSSGKLSFLAIVPIVVLELVLDFF